MGGRRGRSDPNSGTTTVEQWNSGTATEPTEQEEKIINLLNDRNDISGIKPSDRSVDQQKKLRSLQYQLKKLDKEVDMVLDKFPDLKRKKQMTIAERKKMTQDQREEARRSLQERMESNGENLIQDQRDEARRADVEQHQEQEQEQDQAQDQEQDQEQHQEEDQLMKERENQGLPHMQQLLRLQNRLNVCYANAGTNALLSSP